MTEDIPKIAMLIDADNTQVNKMESAIQEISKTGKIVVKRAYGNWTREPLIASTAWRAVFRKLAIKPIQQIDYIKGKNATDIALTIDAMDFLYNSQYDGFAIVSSDSDFTPLAIKLRESGKFVMGIGNKQTSESFVKSCDNFVYLENLFDQEEEMEESEHDDSKDKTKPEKKNNNSVTAGAVQRIFDTIGIRRKDPLLELKNLLKIAWETYQDDEGFTNISAAGSYIKRVKPDFDIKSYGVTKLPEYLKKHENLYEVKTYPGKGKVTIIAYRVKE